MSEVIVSSLRNLQNEVHYGSGKILITDEPSEIGGEDAGPDPYTLLLAALGSCISMTVTLYARRKQWPLEQVTVRCAKTASTRKIVRSVCRTQKDMSTESSVP